MLTFRDLTLADHDLILPMVQDFYQGDAVLHPVELEILERTFRDATDAQEPLLRGLLLEVDGQPAGYVYITQCYSAEVGGRCIFLEELYLMPAFRGRGLGREILAWIERQYPTARRFRLEVNEVNQNAVHLYQKSGYEYLLYDLMVIDKNK